MIPVQFPEHDFKIKIIKGRESIFDAMRKQWLVLTPEEWVRQNFLQYMIQTMAYPASLISVEREIALGELRKRFDIVVYDRNGKPWMLVECKAMDIALDQYVLQQILNYNQTLQVKYLMLTNGGYTKGFALQPTAMEINEMPNFIK